MRPILPVTLGMVALAVLAAGCDGGTGGSPTSSPSASSAPATKAAPSTAPKVPAPLATSKVVKDPCSALTAADLGPLGLDGAQAKVDDTANNSGCQWRVASSGVLDGVTWMTTQPTGLNSVYAKGSLQGGYFIPTTVDGYPAVFQDDGDLRQSGTCDISVGATDSLYFYVEYDIATASDSQANATKSCSLAKQTAATVVKNLKANGGS